MKSAVKLLLPGGLAKHTIIEGANAVPLFKTDYIQELVIEEKKEAIPEDSLEELR